MKKTLAALGLALIAVGCVDNNASVQMVGICAMPDTGCTFPAECTLFHGGNYEWDVSVGDEMVLPIQVRNQVAPVTSDVAVNTNDAKIYRTVTEYTVVGEALVVDPSTGASTQLVIPRSTANVSQHVEAGGAGVVFAKPFSSSTTGYLNGLLASTDRFLVLARLHLEGEYDNGSSIRTGEIEIPVYVCSGCVAPPACVAPAVLVSVCPGPGQTPSSATCKAPVAPPVP